MKLNVTQAEDVQTQSTYAGSTNVRGLRWSKLLSPEDYRLWLGLSELDDGAVLTWDEHHGDEVLYVLQGALNVQGHRSPTEGAVVVEGGAVGEAQAEGPTLLAHFGTRDGSSPAKRGRFFHV